MLSIHRVSAAIVCKLCNIILQFVGNIVVIALNAKYSAIMLDIIAIKQYNENKSAIYARLCVMSRSERLSQEV